MNVARLNNDRPNIFHIVERRVGHAHNFWPERKCCQAGRQMGRANNSKNQLAIVSFYKTFSFLSRPLFFSILFCVVGKFDEIVKGKFIFTCPRTGPAPWKIKVNHRQQIWSKRKCVAMDLWVWTLGLLAKLDSVKLFVVLGDWLWLGWESFCIWCVIWYFNKKLQDGI